jgi:hypothetical protein
MDREQMMWSVWRGPLNTGANRTNGDIKNLRDVDLEILYKKKLVIDTLYQEWKVHLNRLIPEEEEDEEEWEYE